MSNKEKGTHLRKPDGSRVFCRYAARPSRNIEGLRLIAFRDVPVTLRCIECHRFYESLKNRDA